MTTNSAGLSMLGNRISPWTERLEWILRLKNLPYSYEEYEEDSAVIEPIRDTGLHTVPILWENDELIGDSDVAADWLEDRFPTPELLPSEPSIRAPVRSWELAASYTVAPLARLINIGKFHRMGFSKLGERSAKRYGWSEGKAANAELVLRRFLQDLVQVVRGADYLVSHRFTRADLTMACMLFPVFGPRPEERSSKELGARILFGIELGNEPEMAPLRAWRDSIYERHAPCPPTSE